MADAQQNGWVINHKERDHLTKDIWGSSTSYQPVSKNVYHDKYSLYLHLWHLIASCSHLGIIFLTEILKTTLRFISTLSNTHHPNIQMTNLDQPYFKWQVSVSVITTWAGNISNAIPEEDSCLHDATKKASQGKQTMNKTHHHSADVSRKASTSNALTSRLLELWGLGAAKVRTETYWKWGPFPFSASSSHAHSLACSTEYSMVDFTTSSTTSLE